MRIRKMTATFGKLEGATLTLEPGLNVLSAPNEGGKSTWCAFLRAMLYGIPTRERDTKTSLAEKNRYAPWSGSPMAGEVDITWDGRDITLRRFPKGASPFGGFEAVDSRTGEPVPGLTGDNCGEVLLGVGRETFQRSAFVGQSGVPIDGDPELERRIAALVSSGEEDVSFSEAEDRLKTWLRRRKFNKSGLIPRDEAELAGLEGELAQMRQFARQMGETQAQLRELEDRRAALEAEAAAQKARQEWALREQYRGAVAELDAARAELAALQQEAGPLPPKDLLLQAQGDLAYVNTLSAQCKEAQNQLGPARQAAQEAAQAAVDPVFQGMGPEEARRKAADDCATAEVKTKWWTSWFVCGVGWLILGAVRLMWGDGLTGGISLLLGVGNLARGVQWYRRDRAKRAVLAAYGAESAGDIRRRAETYAARWAAADEAQRKAQAVEDSLTSLTAQREGLLGRLLSFVGPFAPTVTDLFGVSAALSRALSLDERMATAKVKLESAQRLVSSIPYPRGDRPPYEGGSDEGGGGSPPSPVPPPPPSATPVQTAAALAAVNAELSRRERELAALQGRRAAMGDPAELETRREAVSLDLDRRREEHRALTLALDTLSEASADLQARFSPDLNRRAGEIFAALTGGRYEGVALTKEFEASVKETGGVLPRRSLSLSRGTVDQLYLAVRLAVCELALPGSDPAPLVLDDALSDFDDERMALALDYLKGLPRQVLLFTCHGREQAYLE